MASLNLLIRIKIKLFTTRIIGKNYFFLETFPNACFWKNVFGKMSFGEAVFPKSHYSVLEKLRGNRDWHSVAREHVSAAFSGRNAQGGVH